MSVALGKPEPDVKTASTGSPDVAPAEPAPVQVATANPFDFLPGTTGKAVNSIEIVDECLVVDLCVDHYLWALFSGPPWRTPSRSMNRRKVTIKRKGKMVTVWKTLTKLVDEDFTWKDPKAAERAGKSMMDYVIGGIDRGFKLKLFFIRFTPPRRRGFRPASPAHSATTTGSRSQAGSRRRATSPIMAGAPAAAMGMGFTADIVERPGRRRATSDGPPPKGSGSGLMRMGRNSRLDARISAGTRRMSPRWNGREYAAHSGGFQTRGVGREEGEARGDPG